MAEAATAYAAAARTYAKAMKAADAEWPAVWCGTRIGRSPDPCDKSSVMNASVRAFRKSMAMGAAAISAFIDNVKAMRFPTAAVSAGNTCVATDVADVTALNLAAAVCNLTAAAVRYRDQSARAARGKSYPQIEPKWIEALVLESQAQRQANVLREALGLRLIPKQASGSMFYEGGRF
jgi:hypothetical protein